MEQVTQNMNKKNLKSLVKTSSICHSVVTPILYKTISLTFPATAYHMILTLLGAIHGQFCIVLFAKVSSLSEIKAALLETLYVNADETYPSSNWSGHPPQGIRLLAASGPLSRYLGTPTARACLPVYSLCRFELPAE